MTAAETSIRELIVRTPERRRPTPKVAVLETTHPRSLALPHPCSCVNGLCKGNATGPVHCKAHMADTLDIA